MKASVNEILNFGNETPRSFGLVKVNSSNYSKIKGAKRFDIIYHDVTDTLLFGDNVIMIDDSLANDIAMYRENLLPAPQQQDDFNLFYSPIALPPIRPIELFNLPII